MTIMTPREVAAEIRVRPGPDGGHFYNGLLTLEDAARRIEPAIGQLDSQTKSSFLKVLEHELGLNDTRRLDDVWFPLEA
ncbi:MAG: hypothetical protein U5R46_08525 [Gammaproteobacteria bacterium]|nr:hypothetical protein [Gammaproteobacteria bacterium]